MLNILLSILFTIAAPQQSIDMVLEKLDASKGLRAEFIYELGDYKAVGSYYGYGEQFYLESEDLRGWYDGEQLWTYLAQRGEVNLTLPDWQDLTELNPLVSILQIAKRDYIITPTSYGLRARPSQPDGIYEWVNVHVDTQGTPVKLEIKEVGMDEVLVVQITSLKRGPFAEMKQRDFFRFTADKLPGVEVIDLR